MHARKRDSTDRGGANAGGTRLVALVITVAMVVWVGVQWLGRYFDWDVRYAFLADFAAIGALFWALVVTIRIWRARRD